MTPPEKKKESQLPQTPQSPSEQMEEIRAIFAGIIDRLAEFLKRQEENPMTRKQQTELERKIWKAYLAEVKKLIPQEPDGIALETLDKATLAVARATNQKEAVEQAERLISGGSVPTHPHEDWREAFGA